VQELPPIRRANAGNNTRPSAAMGRTAGTGRCERSVVKGKNDGVDEQKWTCEKWHDGENNGRKIARREPPAVGKRNAPSAPRLPAIQEPGMCTTMTGGFPDLRIHGLGP